MKLLLDQNLSFRIAGKIQIEYPDSQGVKEAGLFGMSDREIREFAIKNDFAIVTFD